MQSKKYVLSNGLEVLVVPQKTIPKVSLQLWYRVGSKDEQSKEKGIAHLIEHMIFKGTKKLSESDINLIVHKLSGYCNAFTSYDYTGYLFDLPAHNWEKALPLMADCMTECTFKEELLASELKAVIQELKMYKDNYVLDLIEKMTSAIFAGHAYQHPIIGYKHDLWNLSREKLVAFYKRYYVPNNAILVVVGDVEPEEVYEQVKKIFGPIQSGKTPPKAEQHLPLDIERKSVYLYRDVQQPVLLFAYRIPGACEKTDYLVDVMSWIIGSGRGSRLKQKLVYDLGVATDVESFAYDLFDGGLFFIEVHPKEVASREQISALIDKELGQLASEGPTKIELLRAQKNIQKDFSSLLESTQKHAYALGKTYLATGDEQYLAHYLEQDATVLGEEVQKFAEQYLRHTVRHSGEVLPLPEEEKRFWQEQQVVSDQEDERVLSGRKRLTPVEPGVHVHEVASAPAKNFTFPHYEQFSLKNGLEVVFYNNLTVPKIDLLLDLKADALYDPEGKEGLHNFMSKLLVEGTKNYTGQQLADAIETCGMSLETGAGYIALSLLRDDLEHGLALLYEILTAPLFEQEAIEKVRARLQAQVKLFWDDPTQFSDQLVRNELYKGHPYSKNPLGTEQAIASIMHDEIKGCFDQSVTPKGARLAIVGDLRGADLPLLLDKTLGSWDGSHITDIVYPNLHTVVDKEILYPINRDQVVLTFAGRSVDRMHVDYDALLLFDQVFTGGVLGSMSSRLFQLREQSGLFYTIGGSLLAKSGKQPGMVKVRTIVSLDRLAEAEKQIARAIDTAYQQLTDDELQQAKSALASAMIDNFESNQKIAQAFLFLRRYDFPAHYFDNRAKQLELIDKQRVCEVAKQYLASSKMIRVKVGRL